MRLHAIIQIPAEATAGDIREVEEFLTGHGYPRLNLRLLRIDFDFESSDAEPSPLTSLVTAVAIEEAGRDFIEGIEGADLSTLRKIIEQVLGVTERWQEVVDELRTHGWMAEPTVQRAEMVA